MKQIRNSDNFLVFTYSHVLTIFLVVNVALDLALHLVELGVEADEHPGVIECLFLGIDSPMDHHFVMA